MFYHHITNHLVSVRAITNASTGTVVETSDYLPFGTRWSQTSGTSTATLTDATNRWRYSGKEEQKAINSTLPLIDYGARMYDPTWWIEDARDGISRPVVFISLSDRLVNHSSGFPKAVESLAAGYDVHIVSSVDYNSAGESGEIFKWCETNLGVPVWDRVTVCSHKNLLLGDYLIDAEPDSNGARDFMGTLIHFGSDTFKTWEDVLTFFSRLGGQ